ncbi:NAD(P)-binding protein [Melanomma pulvis-pyrius CBS 109.77]|uniref:NAD(P)-binding protein n=1 Tax=Melanomma pulvis-pyrius CBS 109.77 TaxID=1314802 RepID=A0A6A6XIU9_9PLEO|nr:NAD(P)-binding protein [Melanomma pulvis-pyrius CBS 109.77]
MSTDRSDPTLEYTLPFQLTKKIHRKVPDILQPEREENNQRGKIVVITGGGTGIGAATAAVWTRAGAAGVVIAGRRKEKLDETVHALQKLNKGTTKILAIPTDLKVEGDATNLFQQVNKAFGRPADVVIANAGALSDIKLLAEDTIANWWNIYEINVLGLHNTVAAWIKSQPDPKNPVGTVIDVNSCLAGKIMPGNSAYSTSKLATHRYMEFLDAEYPGIRSFTLLPGVVATDINVGTAFVVYARDEAEQTGALALYLASSRADYLKGSLTSVNWDLEEMEEHKEDIENGLLKLKLVPILPAAGGSGF